MYIIKLLKLNILIFRHKCCATFDIRLNGKFKRDCDRTRGCGFAAVVCYGLEAS